MDKEISFTLIRRVLDRLESHSRKIDSETYMYLVDCISEVISEKSDGAAEALDELKDYTYAARAYRHVGRLEGFDDGACWGMMQIYEAYSSAKERHENEQRQMDEATRNQEVLLAIHGNPGITHGKLADKMGITPSRLSQILGRIKPYCFFVTSIEGRSKHYRLSGHGEALLRAIPTPHKRSWNNETSYDGVSSRPFSVQAEPWPDDKNKSASGRTITNGNTSAEFMRTETAFSMAV